MVYGNIHITKHKTIGLSMKEAFVPLDGIQLKGPVTNKGWVGGWWMGVLQNGKIVGPNIFCASLTPLRLIQSKMLHTPPPHSRVETCCPPPSFSA